MFNPTGEVIEVYSRKEYGYALRWHVDIIAEAIGPVIKKEEVAANV